MPSAPRDPLGVRPVQGLDGGPGGQRKPHGQGSFRDTLALLKMRLFSWELGGTWHGAVSGAPGASGAAPFLRLGPRAFRGGGFCWEWLPGTVGSERSRA